MIPVTQEIAEELQHIWNERGFYAALPLHLLSGNAKLPLHLLSGHDAPPAHTGRKGGRICPSPIP